MIIDILLGILLLLGIAWVTLGIAYLWRLFQDPAALSGKNTPKQKAGKPGESPQPSVSQEQIASARHILVGASLSLPRLSLKFPPFPLLKIQPKILILLQGKTPK